MASSEAEFTIRLDTVDAAFLGTNKAIPGATIEEKLRFLVETELRAFAEAALETDEEAMQ